MSRKSFLIACLITLVTILLYLYKIDQITPGAWGDEIVIGQVSLKLVEGKILTPFEPTNYGHPTPLLYLIGITLKLFGKSLTSLRLMSVVFGALASGLMYILIKAMSKNTHLALASAIIISTIYPQIILSRFAYEMSAAIFFELLAILFLYFYFKKPTVINSGLIALAISMGLWTYLGFRTLAVSLLIIFVIMIVKTTDSVKTKLSHLLVVVLTISILTGPLLVYGMKYPDQFWARTKSLSVFHYGLPKAEISKELIAATKRTLGMFFTTGDPNPRQNPAQTAVFDLETTGLMLTGLVFGLISYSWIATAGLLLMTTSLLNDILTLERIPEFHYYGLGHPNTLRISTIIPVVVLLAVFGMYKLGSYIKDRTNTAFFYYLIACTLVVINLNKYFNQDILAFNYQVNGVPMLRAVEMINSTQGPVAASKSIINDQRVKFLIKKPIQEVTLTEIMRTSLENNYQAILIDPQNQIDLTKEFLTQPEKYTDYQITSDISPFNTINFLILKP